MAYTTVYAKLEAMLIVMNKEEMLLVSGTGEVITPDDGILAIGSGGNFALSAARAMKTLAIKKCQRKRLLKCLKYCCRYLCIYES